MLIVFTKIMDFFKLGFCLFPFNLHAIDIKRLKAYVPSFEILFYYIPAIDIKRLTVYSVLETLYSEILKKIGTNKIRPNSYNLVDANAHV